MKFLTLAEKELQTLAYTSIDMPHLLISITEPGRDAVIPKLHHCKEILRLHFHDIQNVSKDYTCFDSSMAKKIIDFVNLNANRVELIVVHCYAGVSRSVAVASALAKIINHKDDNIFSRGVPNMMVYSTILDAYFLTPNAHKKWPKIHYLRTLSMKQELSPVVNKIWTYKIEHNGDIL